VNEKKGVSGNPKGRPPKERALTAILEKAGNQVITDADGKRRGKKRIVARLLWEVATTGTCAFPDGKGGSRQLQPQNVEEWFDIIKWIYTHIDGAAPKAIDIQSQGRPLQPNVIVVREMLSDDDEGE